MGIQAALDLPYEWESSFLPPEVVKAATTDPSLWPLVAGELSGDRPGFALDTARAWTEMSQVMTYHLALNNGIDGSVYDIVVPGMENYNGIVNATSVEQVWQSVLNTTVSIAVNAIGAVPIVGAVVKGLDSMVRMLIGAFTYSSEPPPEILLPFQTYLQETDEFKVKTSLGIIRDFRWDDLYLPSFEGDWMVEKRENGYTFRPRQVTGGYGFIPGSQRCSSAINVWFTQKSARDQRRWSQFATPVNLAAATDTGDFYPGFTQLMTSIDQQVQKAQTQMWNINVDRIRLAWDDYVYSGIRFAGDVFSGKYKEGGISRLSVEQREQLARAFVGQLLLSRGIKGGFGAGTGWFPEDRSPSQEPSIFEEIVKPWARRMERRQLHNLGTRQMVSASSRGGAFTDMNMLNLLLKNRKLLLDHPEVDNVNFRNIVDPLFKQQVMEARTSKAGIADRFTAKAPAMIIASPDGGVSGPKGGYPGQEPSNWPWWVAATALAVGGGFLYKNWRKR